MDGHDMKLWADLGVDEVLLHQPQRPIFNAVGLFVTCAGIFILTVLYEGLRLIKTQIYFRELARNIGYLCVRLYRRYHPHIRGSMVFHEEQAQDAKYAIMTDSVPILQTILLLFAFISLCCILAYISFNIWVFIGLLLGAIFGHVIFGHERHFLEDTDEENTGKLTLFWYSVKKHWNDVTGWIYRRLYYGPEVVLRSDSFDQSESGYQNHDI